MFQKTVTTSISHKNKVFEQDKDKLNETSGNKVVTVVCLDGKSITYSMAKRLKKNLDTKVIPALHKRDKDCVLVIDGREGSGKSTLAMQIGKYVDPSLDLKRVVFTPND